MHMADALLSPAVGGAMIAVSTGAMVVTAIKMNKEQLSEQKIPMMGIMGAFVFAAQMINFTIPGTGASGHIGGGILLAALLGGGPALFAIAAVLVIQALLFADGGILALGCNIFNMGVLPCLIAYPLLFKPIVKKNMNKGRLTVASIVAVVLGLQLGAFMVVLQTQASGITSLPFGVFVALMQPIHLAIGVVEGLITAAVLCFVHQTRPELLDVAAEQQTTGKWSKKAVLGTLLALTLVVGGGLSLFASAYPDGLEWSLERVAGTAELESEEALHAQLDAVQQKTALLPDYGFQSEAYEAAGTATSGVVGSAVTLGITALIGFGLYGLKRKRRDTCS